MISSFNTFLGRGTFFCPLLSGEGTTGGLGGVLGRFVTGVLAMSHLSVIGLRGKAVLRVPAWDCIALNRFSGSMRG